MKDYVGPDEYPIKCIPEIAWWSENYAAMFSSPGAKVALLYSAGRWHADPSVWRELIMIALPNDRILYHKGYSRASTSTTVSGGLSEYEIVEPGKKMHLRFDGPMAESTITDLVAEGARFESTGRCRIDLKFDGLAAVWDMKGDSDAATSFAGSMHVEQVGRASGSIAYDGTSSSFADGYCVRDHSRGPRDIAKFAGHNWLNGVFPDGTSFHVYAAKMKDRRELAMSNAVVIQGDRIMQATVRETQFAQSPGDRGKLHRILLDCELGEVLIEVCEVLNTVPLSVVAPFDTGPGTAKHRWSGFQLDESVRLRWDGRNGFGWSERGMVLDDL
jgi:hypothetical protein